MVGAVMDLAKNRTINLIMNIILASTSPRRSELLRLARLDFSTLAVNIDERYLPNESPTDYICRMVKDKMQGAISLIHTNSSTLILTADTIGVLPDGQILIKPTGKADAFAMWAKMSDTTHQVWTAVKACLLIDQKIVWQDDILQKTEVQFIPLTPQKMDDYWATGEPADKAGAYAIQGFGASWVKAINGSYSNVVGLPLAETVALIEQGRAIANA